MISMKYVISAAAILLVNVGVFALPQGGRIEQGAGNLDNPAHIIQESQHLQTRWNSFDIGAKEQVRIQQPNAQASINIKVRNGAATNINGTLTANGRVSLENPAGIQFGANSVVNVGGLLVSSSNGAVTGLGQVSAAEVVRFQGLSSKNIVNVGGAVSAQEIIVESNGDIVIGDSAHFTASKQILIGGGYQGKDLSVLNAQTNDVKASAQINAPYVVVWSDKVTRFLGRINAGKGFVEVSGKRNLIFPDISRVKSGMLLLDPENITIVAGPGADDGLLVSRIIQADNTPGASFILGAAAVGGNAQPVILRATGTITVDGDITRNNRLTLGANNIVINANITINGTSYLRLELTGVAPSVPLVFGSGGSLTTNEVWVDINYTDSYQFTPDASFTAHFSVPGRSISITNPNGSVTLDHGLDLCATDGTGCGGLTIEDAGALTLGGTFALGTTELTVTAGAIVFNSGTDITSTSVALTQVDAFPVTAAPATFSTPPALSAFVGFDKLSWGGCGLNCFDPAVDIVVTDGDLEAAIAAKGRSIVGNRLSIGHLSLRSTGVPLVIPAGLESILVENRGSVSITGGLTAPGPLIFFSDRIELGGTFETGTGGSGDLSLDPVGGVLRVRVAADLTFNSHVITGVDVPSLGSLDFNVTFNSVQFDYASNFRSFVVLGKNITLNGALTFGGSAVITAANDIAVNDAITTTRALALEATAGGITFTGTPAITATNSITLTQADEFSNTAPANFGTITPAIVRTGTTPQRTVSWATGGATVAGNVIVDAGSADINFADEIMGYFDIPAAGDISISGFTLSLTTTGTIIFPAHLISIVSSGSGTLSLSAGGISGSNTTSFSVTTGNLALKGAFDFGSASVALNGGNQLDFSKGAVSITAGNLTINGATNSSGSLAGSDPLTFTATGNLVLSRHIGASATPINLSYGGTLSSGLGSAPTFATSALNITHTGFDATTLPSWAFGTYSTTLTMPSSINIAAATTWTGSSITFTTNTNIRGNGALTLNVPMVDAGTNNITITLPSLTLGTSTTMTAANIILKATAGGIDFGTTSMITATTITLSQTDSYAPNLPATFSTPPILTASSNFNKPVWGVCGMNCLASANLDITDGDLGAALVNRFALTGTTLDLVSFNLTASGTPLDIPSNITSITTTGTISITGGLTASAALSLSADTALTIGGTWGLGSNALALTVGAGAIGFNNGSVITASAIALTQVDAFPRVAPTTVSFGSTTPSIVSTSRGVPWATGGAIIAQDLSLDSTTDIILVDVIAGYFAIDANGVLDLGDHNLILSTSTAIVLPANLTSIISASTNSLRGMVSFSALGGISGFGNSFAITARELSLGGAFDFGSATVSLEGTARVIFIAPPSTISARDLTVTIGSGSSHFPSVVTLTATNDLTLEGSSINSTFPINLSYGGTLGGTPTLANVIPLDALNVTYTGSGSTTLPSWVFGNYPTTLTGMPEISIAVDTTWAGTSVTFAGDTNITRAAGAVGAAGALTLNLTTVDAGSNNLTINLPAVTFGASSTITATNIDLTATAGAIAFGAGSAVTATATNLSQTAAYEAAAPAAFTPAPTVASPNNFNKPSWGGCGANCFVGANLDITDGDLTAALMGVFFLTGTTGTTLDLGSFNLTASGTSLDIPSTITTITTTGTISITGGLTTSAALTLTAPTLTLGGAIAINLGANILNLNFGTSIVGGATAPTLTASQVIIRHTGSGTVALPEGLFTGQNVFLHVAKISIPTATTWDVVGLGFGVDTTITGEALTLTTTASFIGSASFDLTIDVASLSVGSDMTLLAPNLNVTSRAAGADNGFNLKLSAAPNLTVAGHINAGTGILALEAGNGEIIFTNNPTITAGSITLVQGMPYVSAEPAQFSVTPVASRSGITAGTPYGIAEWAACPATPTDCRVPQNISVINQTTDIILTDLIAGKFDVLAGELNLFGSDLVLSTTANIVLPDDLRSITMTGNITLVANSIVTVGGTAITHNLAINARGLILRGTFAAGTNNLVLTATGALSFDGDTTISGSNVKLGGDVAPAASTTNPVLSVMALSSLELSGFVNVGTGSIALTTNVDGITFTGATLTAASIALTQPDAYATAAPATFNVPPVLIRTGNDNFTAPSWSVCGVDAECFTPVDIDHTAAGNVALVDLLGTAFFIAGGVLDLSSSNFSINIGGTLTLPAGLNTIRTAGGNITLIANTISATTVGALTIETTTSGDITLQGSYNAGSSSLTITAAGALNFGTGAETSLSGNLLTLGSGAAATASGQKLTLVGNLAITFNNTDINVAELVLDTQGGFTGTPTITADDLTLTYRGGNSSTSTYAGSHWVFAAGRNVTLSTPNSGAIMTLFAANATDTIDLCAADGTNCGNLTLESGNSIQLAGSTQTSASLGTISANNISLKAASIGSGSNVNRNLILNVAGDLTIDTPTFTLRNTLGAALTFNVAGSTTFTQDITLDAETMSGLGGTIEAQALTLATAASATGSITFDATRPTNITAMGAVSMDAASITEFGGTISAPSLTLTSSGSTTSSLAFSTTQDTTITTTGAVSIDAATITAFGGTFTASALTLTTGSSATGSIAFSTAQAANITTGALSMDAATITAFGGSLTIESLNLSSGNSTTGSIAFSTARATDITTTGALTLEFETAAAPSGQNLSLTATGGDITLGSLNIGSGTLEVTTDQNVAFTGTPAITAAEVFLTWAGSTDFAATAPATFTTDGTTLILPFIEAPSQTAGTWFQLAGFSFDGGANDIDFSSPLTLNRGTETLVVSVNADGVLDFGDNIIRLTTTGNIILPASIREIRATNLAIDAAGIGSAAADAPFANPLSIITTDDLELNTTIAMTAGTPLNLSFGDDLEGVLTLTTTNLGIAYTGTGTAAITLPSWVFTNVTRELRLSVANITFSSDETWRAASITFGTDTTITSTSDLVLNVSTLDAGTNALTIDVANLSFSQASASTITGSAVSLTSTTAPTLGSGENLTITATTGNLTLEGAFNVSPGGMFLAAPQGIIAFTGAPRLTASAFSLTQGSVAFSATKPATFVNAASANVAPTIRLTTGVQLPVDWDVMTFSESLPKTASGGYDLSALLSTGGMLERFETNGVLNFGDTDLVLGSTDNISIPDRITEIRGRNIIISATMFGRGDASATNPLNRELEFIATENIVFMADVQSDNRIIFTGRSITFNSAKATQISGSEILIETTSAGRANHQNVTLEATGDIMLNANLNIGLGSVVVNAGGELITTDANTITAHTITYNAATIRNGASEVRLTAYDNIYLIGTSLNNRDAPVSLIAGGSIVTGGAFAITGSAVHFEQGQARYQAGRLTLHALTGGLTIVGPVARDMTTLIVSGHDQLDRSNAVIGGNVTVEISP